MAILIIYKMYAYLVCISNRIFCDSLLTFDLMIAIKTNFVLLYYINI